jgi:histidinol-phosphate/aromatic aminotransferase/cobyric acid decarboxylase-like protein
VTTIPAPGPHGGDGPRVAEALGLGPDQVLDLSASLNPFAPDVAALAAPHVDSLRRYPDLDAAERLLAEAVGVPGERLVITAGGSQAIALVGDHLGRGWIEEPDFSLYRRHLSRIEVGAPRWRSDPHNPTGRLATTGDDRVAVWDEAFLPLSAGTWTRGRPGWGLGSLTKAFACPGLRLGFAVAPDERVAAAVRRRRPAWAVGSLGCAVLPDLLARADLAGWTARIAAARGELTQVLRAHGLMPLPSDAPWVLAAAAPEGLRAALARHAVAVRDCRSFGLRGHVRIAVPDASGLERLDAALARVRDVGDHDRP